MSSLIPILLLPELQDLTVCIKRLLENKMGLAVTLTLAGQSKLLKSKIHVCS